jgi:hypothetical protein
MSLKNPVTPPGIDPGTVRLVAQRLNHYATPGPWRHERLNKNANKIKIHSKTRLFCPEEANKYILALAAACCSPVHTSQTSEKRTKPKNTICGRNAALRGYGYKQPTAKSVAASDVCIPRPSSRNPFCIQNTKSVIHKEQTYNEWILCIGNKMVLSNILRLQ